MLFKQTARGRDRTAGSKTIFRSSRQGFARLGLERLDERVVPAFADPVNYTVGSNPRVVVAADFNNDGRLDLASANYANGLDSTFSVLLGNANGTFSPALHSSTGPQASSLVAGDFNNDGKIDLVSYSNTSVSVLLGRGDGTFQPPVSVFSNSDEEVISVAVGDFTSDGKADLGVLLSGWTGNSDPDFVGGDVAGALSVLVGTGTGSFTPSSVYPVGWDYFSAGAVADLNADGRLDFAAAGDWGTSVLLGNGAGSFGYPNTFGGLGSSSEGPLVAADLNADGKIDLARAFTRVSSVSMMLGTGAGQFSTVQYLGVNGQPNSLTAADFNGDGHTDLLTTYTGSASVDVLLGKASGGFTPPVTVDAGALPLGVAVGDFNGDGRMDVATVNPASNSVSVLINDGAWLPTTAPEISVNNVTVMEGNTGSVNAGFTVSLSAASSQTVTIQYATADSTASAAAGDYQQRSGTLTYAPGETQKSITVPVNGDRLSENTEYYFLRLTNPTNAFVAKGSGVGTIVDDEPRITIDSGPIGVVEGNTGTTPAVFTLRLSNAYDLPVDVSYLVAEGNTEWWEQGYDEPPPAATSGVDFSPGSGRVTFAPGETTMTLAVPAKGDRIGEPNEYFSVNLTGTSLGGIDESRDHAVGIIVDDEPRVSIGGATATEGNTGTTNMTFTVSLDSDYDQPVTVSYATANLTATAGSDYQAKSGSVTFAAGETTKSISVKVNGDRIGEPSEYLSVHVTGTGDVILLNDTGYGTIFDNEPAVYISDVSKLEGKKGTTLFVFTVTLDQVYDQNVTMSFRTLNGTAIAGSDYVAKSGTLTFKPGETTKTITIEVNGDKANEQDEYFQVELFGLSSNASFGNIVGYGWILNDD